MPRYVRNVRGVDYLSCDGVDVSLAMERRTTQEPCVCAHQQDDHGEQQFRGDEDATVVRNRHIPSGTTVGPRMVRKIEGIS